MPYSQGDPPKPAPHRSRTGSVLDRPYPQLVSDQKVGLGAVRGAAFYVGALVGPGVLVVPSLAAQAAGPASVLAWGALLVLSVALAATFALLGTRHPVVGGVTAYVQEGFGELASGVTGVWFVTAVTF